MLSAALPHLDAARLDRAMAECRIARFASSEVLRLPHRDTGRRLVILKGAAAANLELYVDPLGYGRAVSRDLSSFHVEELTSRARLREISDRLAADVGPVAGRLIRSAVKATDSWTALVEHLAGAIPEGPRRDRFRHDVTHHLDDRATLSAGHLVDLRSIDGTSAAPLPELRAVTEVIVATLPPALIDLAGDMAAE